MARVVLSEQSIVGQFLFEDVGSFRGCFVKRNRLVLILEHLYFGIQLFLFVKYFLIFLIFILLWLFFEVIGKILLMRSISSRRWRRVGLLTGLLHGCQCFLYIMRNTSRSQLDCSRMMVATVKSSRLRISQIFNALSICSGVS